MADSNAQRRRDAEARAALQAAAFQLAEVENFLREQAGVGRTDRSPTERGLMQLAIALVAVVRREFDGTKQMDEVAYFRLQLQQFTIIKEVAEALAQYTAIEGVAAGALSRKLASEIMGVHQATVARWVKDRDTGRANQSYKQPDELPRGMHIHPDKVVADETIDDD